VRRTEHPEGHGKKLKKRKDNGEKRRERDSSFTESYKIEML
jgi:hypothetical protein